MDCRPPGSSVHGIIQARILQWVAMPSSRESFWARNQTHASCSSCIAGGFFTTEPLGKPFCCVLTALFGLPQWLSGEGNGTPLQYSCVENPMDKGAWQATAHGVTKSWTWLKRLSSHATTLFIITIFDHEGNLVHMHTETHRVLIDLCFTLFFYSV